MDEYTRGWEEPYLRDMDRTIPHSNSLEGMHDMQDDYEMTNIISRPKYPESREAYGVYTTNEEKWQPTSCSNCY